MKLPAVLAVVLTLSGPPRSAGQHDAARQQQQQLEQQRMEQQRLEAERRAAEALEREAQQLRQNFANSIKALTPVALAKSAPPRAVEPCLSQAGRKDSAYEGGLPLEEWLAGKNIEQFPWNVGFERPRLRIDQRYELAYAASVDLRRLREPGGKQELIYITGVSAPDGRFLAAPRTRRHAWDGVANPDARLRFANCVFLQPGEYTVWIVLYDSLNTRHNVVKRRIEIGPFSSDAQPAMNRQLAPAEFPSAITSSNQTPPGPLLLQASAGRRVALKIIPLFSPVDQWAGRTDLARWVDNQVLSAAGVLSQLRVGQSAGSILALDLVNQRIAFEREQLPLEEWESLAAAFPKAEERHLVDIPALQALQDRSVFFREVMRRELETADDAEQVLILVSGSILFEPGSDVSPLKWEGDCRCRVYHLRFRINADDVFDDTRKLIRPLQPKTLSITTPLDFRKAVVSIAQDLEGPGVPDRR